jgi:hypothetical protein
VAEEIIQLMWMPDWTGKSLKEFAVETGWETTLDSGLTGIGRASRYKVNRVAVYQII